METGGRVVNTRRTRLLVIFVAAAVVVSFFTQWDDVVQGFRDGYGAYRPVTSTR